MNTMLMHECDIYFYEQLQDAVFGKSGNLLHAVGLLPVTAAEENMFFLKTAVSVSSAVKAVSGE
ncbi:MAG: hypothetical protein ACLUIQ_04490 [Dialister invisus]